MVLVVPCDARSPPPLAPDPAAAHPARQDDQGWHNGFNNPALITPHTDALLKEGLKLMHHFVYKFCSPTRSSLLSGRLPVHVNQENSATEQPLAGIPIEMTIWSVLLQKAGYKTAHIGKCTPANPCPWPPGPLALALPPAGLLVFQELLF